jgi:ATP-dependent protease Clp ATPase subunit
MLFVAKCAFCGKNQGVIRGLDGLRRRSVCICEDCLDICRTILAKTTAEHAPAVPSGMYRISSSSPDQNAQLRCSFCDTSQELVDKLIGSPRGRIPAYICDKCVASSLEAIRNDVAQSGPPRSFWHRMARKVGIHSSHIQ